MPPPSLLRVLVKPNAKKNELLLFDKEKLYCEVRIAAVPDKGRANKELIRFLSKELGIRAEIVKGHKSREKLLRILNS